MINKKNLPLYIALAVPVLMIILVAAFIYLPGIGKKPKYNFLYMTGQGIYNYPYGQGFQVSNGRLVYNAPQSQAAALPGGTDFYLYNVADNQAQEVSLDKAESYNLDPSNLSSDGYTVQQGNGSGDFLFGGGAVDYSDWFLKGHNRAVKLNLKLSGTYSGFQFLGWTE